jgi:hypothetical protein
MITAQEVIAGIQTLETLADLALPLAGDAEFVPIVNAAGGLIQKLVTLVTTHAQKTAIAAAVAAVDVEVDAAEAAKVAGKTP